MKSWRKGIRRWKKADLISLKFFASAAKSGSVLQLFVLTRINCTILRSHLKIDLIVSNLSKSIRFSTRERSKKKHHSALKCVAWRRERNSGRKMCQRSDLRDWKWVGFLTYSCDQMLSADELSLSCHPNELSGICFDNKFWNLKRWIIFNVCAKSLSQHFELFYFSSGLKNTREKNGVVHLNNGCWLIHDSSLELLNCFSLPLFHIQI